MDQHFSYVVIVTWLSRVQLGLELLAHFEGTAVVRVAVSIRSGVGVDRSVAVNVDWGVELVLVRGRRSSWAVASSRVQITKRRERVSIFLTVATF